MQHHLLTHSVLLSYRGEREPPWSDPTLHFHSHHWQVMAFRFIFVIGYLFTCYLASLMVQIYVTASTRVTVLRQSEPDAGTTRSINFDILGILATKGKDLGRLIKLLGEYVRFQNSVSFTVLWLVLGTV